MATVSILGSGVMGTALAFPLSDNGHDVRLVGTHLDRDIIESIQETGVHPRLGREIPESVSAYQLEHAEAAFEGAQVVVNGVNSFGVRWAGERLATLLEPGMMVISVTKGVEATRGGDLRIVPDVLADLASPDLRERVSWSAIAGPCIAGELAARRESSVVFTGRNREALLRLADIFRTPYYRVWTSTDFVGVELCAAMKNCYAFGVGFAEGILEKEGEAEGADRNHNYEAALFGQATAELGRMMELLDGRPETPYWLPGVADMYVTSTGGRNVRVGRLVGTGLRLSEARAEMPGVTLEGVAAIEVIGDALRKLTERGIVAPEDFPLMRHLYSVVAEDELPNVPWSAFFGGEA